MKKIIDHDTLLTLNPITLNIFLIMYEQVIWFNRLRINKKYPYQISKVYCSVFILILESVIMLIKKRKKE